MSFWVSVSKRALSFWWHKVTNLDPNLGVYIIVALELGPSTLCGNQSYKGQLHLNLDQQHKTF